jgi:hypothetical protein
VCINGSKKYYSEIDVAWSKNYLAWTSDFKKTITNVLREKFIENVLTNKLKLYKHLNLDSIQY